MYADLRDKGVSPLASATSAGMGTDIITPLGFTPEQVERVAAMGQSLEVRLSNVHTQLDDAAYNAVEQIMVPGPNGMSLNEINSVDHSLEEDAEEVTRIYNDYAKEQSEYDAERERLRADVEEAVTYVPGLKAQAESMAGGVGAYIETVLEPLEGFARRMEAIGIPRAETLSRVRLNLDALVKDWEARERKSLKDEVGRSPLIQHIWGRLDGKLLGIDYPGAYKEISYKYGPKIFGKNGLAPDLLADELVTRGLLAPGSGANELIERLQNGEPEWFQEGSETPSYPNNGRAVGTISDEIAKTLHLDKPGNIVLDDNGIQHIEARHGTEIRNLGFKDGREFVDFVLENLNAVYDVDGKGRKYDLVSRARTPQSRVMVRLEFAENGDFYQVVTAGTVRKHYYDKKTPLWESANLNHSTSGTPDAISGQSGVEQNIASSDAQDKPLFHLKGATSTARGSILPTSEGYLINLFQRANLSTLPHEFGHIFRMEMQRAVDMGIADEAMIQDQQTFEKWLSRFDDNATLEAEYNERLKNNPTFKDRAFSSLSPEEIVQVRETAKHEYFARGFEAYLREGKAPTKGLEGAFQRFKNWLMSIYRSAKKLGVELNDDVREAFDRMIATERDMELTARRNELLSLDEKQLDTLGLSGAEREYASGLMKAAIENAAEERRRDMEQARKERMHDYKRQAREELLKEPVYAAIEDAKQRPLDMDFMIEAIGEKDAEALARRYSNLIIDENGMAPELLAHKHGYNNTAAMLADMLRAEPLDKAIKERAKAKADEIEAVLFRPEDYLISSAKIQEQVELVARHLTENAGQKLIDRRLFAEAAERELAAMPMGRAVNTQRFLADLRRALRQERNALRSGDVKAALKANNKVRLNLEFARQSQQARKLQESAQSDISHFLKNKSANADAKFIVMNIAMNHGLARYNEALARGRDDHSIIHRPTISMEIPAYPFQPCHAHPGSILYG